MSSDSTKPIIFISYAHLDEPDPPEQPRWLSFVMEFLRPGVKGRKYEVWMDRLMPGGTDWNPEIEARIRSCDIFVLLVSTRSTGSDYIVDKEIPIIRERQRNNDGVYFYPLLLDWTPKAGLEQVNDKNLRPRDARPFSSLSASERSRAMSEAADEIADIAKAVAERRAAVEVAAAIGEIVPGQETPDSPESPADLDYPLYPAYPSYPLGDKVSRPTRSRLASVLVAITGLPETGYERLVGRGEELARLDEAWSDDKTNILSLIAEGGAGKSALVNEWLTRMQADGYRNAERVLGWSFYSQGSKERATAADEFLNWALIKLGVKLDTTSASAKGEAIAEALTKQRALLLLDGVEPLQHGPGPQAGQLKDQGLRALLRRFAAASPRADHSLIVLTSRLAVADLKRFKDGAAPVVDVERLSDEAGAELLRDNDVWGIDRELKAASRDFGGHPLALTLLASFLKETQNGDVRRRDHIRGLIADADNPRHDQARRVMESYEKEWLTGQSVLLAVLHCVGLFDRPASGDCLKALRARPAIHGLTDGLVGLKDEQWRRAVARLREVRLLAPADPSDREALDAHPLVREWFGERLRLINEAAWKAAHSRLYDHLRKTTREGTAPTLAELAPLYHAITHGCGAARYQETLDKVYVKRICRQRPDGGIEFYAVSKLGAVDSSLAAISWFFEKLYETPAAALPPWDRAFVLSEASFALRAQGRLQEALPAMRAALSMAEAAQAWGNAARQAFTLSETELLVANVADALATAKSSTSHAERSGQPNLMSISRATEANALHAAGKVHNAADLFADAERRQQAVRAQFPFLYSMQGYWFCDLLLSQRQAAAALERASHTLQWARTHFSNLTVTLDSLTIGRAHLAEALQSLPKASLGHSARDHARAASTWLREAAERLLASRNNDQIPRGLLARVAFRRSVGDWDRAKSDLNEAKEIAESSEMRLYWCDCALEGARLALARREVFAPLNGLVEPSPPRPVLPDATAAAALREEARKELDVARKLIAECGYHRRDEELAELDAVVASGRRFADLPPRV
jgi:hypothetical protein